MAVTKSQPKRSNEHSKTTVDDLLQKESRPIPQQVIDAFNGAKMVTFIPSVGEITDSILQEIENRCNEDQELIICSLIKRMVSGRDRKVHDTESAQKELALKVVDLTRSAVSLHSNIDTALNTI